MVAPFSQFNYTNGWASKGGRHRYTLSWDNLCRPLRNTLHGIHETRSSVSVAVAHIVRSSVLWCLNSPLRHTADEVIRMPGCRPQNVQVTETVALFSATAYPVGIWFPSPFIYQGTAVRRYNIHRIAVHIFHFSGRILRPGKRRSAISMQEDIEVASKCLAYFNVLVRYRNPLLEKRA